MLVCVVLSSDRLAHRECNDVYASAGYVILGIGYLNVVLYRDYTLVCVWMLCECILLFLLQFFRVGDDLDSETNLFLLQRT